MEQPTYDIVLDQGGNLGLHCYVCNQARWNKNHDTLDWSTQKSCPNCEKLKADGVYTTEVNRYYAATIAELKDSLKNHKQELAKRIKNKNGNTDEENIKVFDLDQNVKKQREKVNKLQDRLDLLQKAEVIVKEKLTRKEVK
jgi:succinate dehydrogenase/fumarate reductase flavoprotein subunit